MKQFEIWIRAWHGNGEHEPERFIGNSIGETSEDAKKNFRYDSDEHNFGIFLHKKGDGIDWQSPEYFTKEITQWHLNPTNQ